MKNFKIKINLRVKIQNNKSIKISKNKPTISNSVVLFVISSDFFYFIFCEYARACESFIDIDRVQVPES